ncbi:MAG: hypothetical protein ACRD2B_12060 [Terriglobia bacterium]
MIAVLADTGPLYAAVDPEDAHQRSQRELPRLVRERRDVVVPYPTLLECYTLVLSVWASNLLRSG